MNKISFNPYDQKSSFGELKVFKRSKENDSVISNSSNPFGITFKGKVLSSDVFESTKEKNNVSFTSKIKNANIALCASVADKFATMGNKITNAFEGVITTTKNLTNVVNKIHNLAKTDVKEILTYIKIRKLRGKDPKELGAMLIENDTRLKNYPKEIPAENKKISAMA